MKILWFISGWGRSRHHGFNTLSILSTWCFSCQWSMSLNDKSDPGRNFSKMVGPAAIKNHQKTRKAEVFIQTLYSIIIKHKGKPVDIRGKMHLDFQQMMEFFLKWLNCLQEHCLLEHWCTFTFTVKHRRHNLTFSLNSACLRDGKIWYLYLTHLLSVLNMPLKMS